MAPEDQALGTPHYECDMKSQQMGCEKEQRGGAGSCLLCWVMLWVKEGKKASV